MTPKPDFCSQCPINQYTSGYVPLQLGSSKTLLVGEAPGENEAAEGKPFVGGSGSFLNNILRAAGIQRSELNVINTIGCQPGIDSKGKGTNVYPTDSKWTHTTREVARTGVEYCRVHHFQPAMEQLNPTKIYAIGDHALSQLTPRSGIMVWRGSPLPLKTDLTQLKVIPTLHPAYLLRDMSLTSVVVKDFQKNLTPPPEIYNLYATTQDLQNYKAKALAFDFEWDWGGGITLCGISDRDYHCTVSGWFGSAVGELRRIFEEATDLIGHNIIGADTKYFEKMEWQIKARLHDTMLKQHLVQPDFRHGLGFVASVFTNKPFWKGTGEEEEDADGNLIKTKVQWKTWNTPDAIPHELGGYGGCTSSDEAYRLYNARDTDSSFQINSKLDLLLDRYDLTKVYWNVSVPIAHIARDISDTGIRINPSRVKEMREYLGGEIDKLEKELPEGLRPVEVAITKMVPAPPDTWKPQTKTCKGTKKNPHEICTIQFTSPTIAESTQCDLCSRVVKPSKWVQVKKLKIPSSKLVRPWNSADVVKKYAKQLGLKEHIDRKRGTSSADVNARKRWGREYSEFKQIDKLKLLGTERNNFTKEKMQRQERLYFNLLVHGTSEGRFASSGKRKGIDPNIQNQPHTTRKIYIPDTPEDCFIELDYASGENMLTAWLAQDFERLERLQTPGFSEHLELARRIFGFPEGTTKKQAQNWDGQDLYDIGKHINHGSNYGMTHVKFREYCEGEGYFFSEAQCKEFIQIGKDLNPGTSLWQSKTIEQAKRDGSLRNVFGRMRWFSTRSVATQSLAFLPASTLADIIIRAMIGHYPERFPDEVGQLGLERVGSLVPGWRIAIQVHDSLVLHGPAHSWKDQFIMTKAIMTQPWKELSGFNLEIEGKVGEPGESWGELKVVHA